MCFHFVCESVCVCMCESVMSRESTIGLITLQQFVGFIVFVRTVCVFKSIPAYVIYSAFVYVHVCSICVSWLIRDAEFVSVIV